MQDFFVDAEHVIHESVIHGIHALDHVSHFQMSNDSQLSCSQLSPCILVLHQYLLHPVQLHRDHVKAVNFRLQQYVVCPLNKSIRHLLPCCVRLEVVQLRGCIGRLAFELVHRCGIQRFAKHLVSVCAEHYHQRIGGHDGLRVMHLPCGHLTGKVYGVVDVIDPIVGVEPQGLMPLHYGGHVRPLVEQISACGHHIWSLVWVISVALALYEGVLIWVPVMETGSATPGSFRRWCACRCNASQATFVPFLLYTALANCSSLHWVLIFFGDCAFNPSHVGRDSQYSFSFPKLIIKCLGVGLVSRCGSHPIRV